MILFIVYLTNHITTTLVTPSIKNMESRSKNGDDQAANTSYDSTSAPFTPHDTTGIFRVGVRPPPFWPEEPAVWFSQLEGNFMLSGIKDEDTKYYYVVSTLEHRYAAEVKDIIVAPPKTGKYERLKTELIKRLSASREKEVKQLLMHEELGDRRPSQFLRHLQRLAGPTVPDEFIKTIWTSRLPTTIQPIIVSQKTADLQALADLADNVHEIVPCTPQIAATSSHDPTASWDAMSRQIAELTRKVEALTKSDERKSRPTNRNHQCNRSRSRSLSNYKRFPTCWYHFKFGTKANKCVKPCDFMKENSQGGR